MFTTPCITRFLLAACLAMSFLLPSAHPQDPRKHGADASHPVQKQTAAVSAGETRHTELDAYWAKVSRAVKEGDFAAYQATCHPDGILVSGKKRTTYPLAKALARWKQGFTATKEGKVKSSVQFRFSQRFGDATTAHETGMFLYTSQKPGEDPVKEYIELEALLTKTPDGWKILMEYQKSSATEAAWEQLHEAVRQELHGEARNQ